MQTTDKQIQTLVDNLLAEGKEYAYITGYLSSMLKQAIDYAPKKHKAECQRDLEWHINRHASTKTV